MALIPTHSTHPRAGYQAPPVWSAGHTAQVIPWVEKGTARGNSKLVAIRTRGPVVFLFKVSESHLSRRNQQRARQTWQWARSCQQVKGMLPPG